MALDYQRLTYQKPRGTKKRTTYQLMTGWPLHSSIDVLPQVAAAVHPTSTVKLSQGAAGIPSGHAEFQIRRKRPVKGWLSNGEQKIKLMPLVSNYYRQGEKQEKDKGVYTNIRSRPKREDRREITATLNELQHKDPYGDMVPEQLHTNFYKTGAGGYDDYHKTFLNYTTKRPVQHYPDVGPPRLRNGRHGGSWRHVKEVMQAHGYRTVFVDGVQRIEDTIRVADGNEPEVNLIQSSVRKPSYSTPSKFFLDQSQRPESYMTGRDLSGFKSTEGINWLIMR